MNDLPPLWESQRKGINGVLTAIDEGARHILLTSPTGGGKSRMVCELIEAFLTCHWQSVIYTNRRLLIDQLVRVVTAHGIECGVRAAGYDDHREWPVQISSMPTERERILKRGKWKVHGHESKTVALVDECHLNAGPTAQQLLGLHEEAGHIRIGVTATPLDLGVLYDTLIIAGNNSELRACGALVLANHYGPDEPDLRHIGKVALGEDLTDKQNVKAIMTPTIFARVWEWWNKLNPEHKPSLLFGPGVAESLWFAEQFWAQGVSAAHIDGKEVWIDGKTYPTSQSARDDILAGSKAGRIKMVCNRFVLREGIDMPWIECGVLATVLGSLQSYLQAGGRLLRASPATGKTHATVIDHGGNWWRHGSLNADREWRLDYTALIVAGLRDERMRKEAEREPVRCPQCARILNGASCLCGYAIQSGSKSRPVVQVDGTLRPMTGDIFKPRQITNRPDAEKIWRSMYHRARKAGMTFRQAYSLFAVENHWKYPDPKLPLMPTQDLDWFKKVSEVPAERLTR